MNIEEQLTVISALTLLREGKKGIEEEKEDLGIVTRIFCTSKCKFISLQDAF